METLFTLTIYTYQGWRRRYPRYDISEGGTYYCHTLAEAEELLHQLLLNKDGGRDLWLPDNALSRQPQLHRLRRRAQDGIYGRRPHASPGGIQEGMYENLKGKTL